LLSVTSGNDSSYFAYFFSKLSHICKFVKITYTVSFYPIIYFELSVFQIHFNKFLWLFCNSFFVLFDECLPTGITFSCNNFSRIKKMTNSCCQTVCTVEIFRKFFQAEQLLKHFSYLFFTGISITCNCHFYLFGFVFRNWD